MENNDFYPDIKDLKRIKSWIKYNMLDIATAHVSELFKFRPTVR